MAGADDVHALRAAVDAALCGAPGVDAVDLRARLGRARAGLLDLLAMQVRRMGAWGGGGAARRAARPGVAATVASASSHVTSRHGSEIFSRTIGFRMRSRWLA